MTDASPPRPSRINRSIDRSIDARREEPDRYRSDRRPSSPRNPSAAENRRPAFTELPTEALDASLLSPDGSSLITGTTQAPRRVRARRQWSALVVATVVVLGAGLALWSFLRPVAPPPLATVRLETVPAGAKVLFEGKPVQGITPLTLPSMKAGTYQVVVSREGYQELHATVAIPATGTVTLEALELKPEPSTEPPPVVVPPPQVPPSAAVVVKLTLETVPTQATIFVNGQERGAAPQVVEAKANEELEVKASAPQHRPLTQKVKVGAGPAQVVQLTLEPLPKPPPVATIKQTRVDPPKPPPEQPKAMVRFAVTPWAEVTCGGRNLGTTPFEAVSLPVGVYQCKFYNPDLGRTLTQKVEVKAAGMNKVVVKF